MDAAIPLGRFFLLGTVLIAAMGCKSDPLAPQPRGQMPEDPLAPIEPPPPTNLPNTMPIPNLAPGVVPAVVSAPVVGSPVPPEVKGNIQNVSLTNAKQLPTVAEMLKNSVPRVKTVAIVGANNVITDQEVIESVWQHYGELSKLDGHARAQKQKELYTIALRETIERELIIDDMYAKLKKANKQGMIDGIRESASSLADRKIREIKKNLGGASDEEFGLWLRVQGLTLPVLRRQFERQFMSQQYISSVMSDKARRVGLAEIRAYFDTHPTEFQTPDRVKWQHIFISVNKHPAKDAFNLAETIRQKVAAGTDFAELSKQYDEGFAKEQNGFGGGEQRGKIQPTDLEETVWSLKPGEMSGVVQTPTGYHIVKVIERDYAGVMPFDIKVQTKIREKLQEAVNEAETKKLVEDLWRKGTVRVMHE